MIHTTTGGRTRRARLITLLAALNVLLPDPAFAAPPATLRIAVPAEGPGVPAVAARLRRQIARAAAALCGGRDGVAAVHNGVRRCRVETIAAAERELRARIAAGLAAACPGRAGC
jgi:hypothetical protein